MLFLRCRCGQPSIVLLVLVVLSAFETVWSVGDGSGSSNGKGKKTKGNARHRRPIQEGQPVSDERMHALVFEHVPEFGNAMHAANQEASRRALHQAENRRAGKAKVELKRAHDAMTSTAKTFSTNHGQDLHRANAYFDALDVDQHHKHRAGIRMAFDEAHELKSMAAQHKRPEPSAGVTKLTLDAQPSDAWATQYTHKLQQAYPGYAHRQ